MSFDTWRSMCHELQCIPCIMHFTVFDVSCVLLSSLCPVLQSVCYMFNVLQVAMCSMCHVLVGLCSMC